jgi:hypothetical protein
MRRTPSWKLHTDTRRFSTIELVGRMVVSRSTMKRVWPGLSCYNMGGEEAAFLGEVEYLQQIT